MTDGPSQAIDATTSTAADNGARLWAMNELVTLTVTDARRAGGLLAARHASERQRFPLLPVAYEDPARAADLVSTTLSFCEGVGALDDDGDLVGFLMSFDSTPDPTSALARYAPARSSLHLVHGHAVAGHVDPAPVYAALFGELATRALDREMLGHVVHVPVGEPAVESAWVALGFGRVSAVAIRDLTPLRRTVAPDVAVRTATADELDIVDRLIDEEAVFHVDGPMFRPYRRDDTADAVRAEIATSLASDDHAFLIARRDGSDIGVISIGPGLGSPLYVPDGGVYIAATAVLPRARGSGAGTSLVEAAFAWARDRGHLAACLHFSTANMASTSFWTGVGFTPVMVHLRRQLDDRVLTKRGSV